MNVKVSAYSDIIEANVSEPHTIELKSEMSLIYIYIYVCVCVLYVWCMCMCNMCGHHAHDS